MTTRRWRSTFVLLALVAALAATALVGSGPARAGSPGWNPHLTRYPYLTDLVGTKVTVNWATDRAAGPSATGTVLWGAVGANGACTPGNRATNVGRSNLAVGPASNPALEYQWTATIDFGAPGRYCYRVTVQGASLPLTDLLGSDPSPVFTTQVPAGSAQPFSFAIFGDWGRALVGPSGQPLLNTHEANVMSQIATSGARFAISVGDNAYNNGSQSDYGDLTQTVNNSVQPPQGMSGVFGPNYWKVPGASIPLFAATGNHGLLRTDALHPQLQNLPEPTAVATSGGRYQMDTIPPTKYGTDPVSIPSTWYAFDAGNARFYVLEAAWPDGNWGSAPYPTGGYANDYEVHWKPGSPEYNWLVADLAAHQSTPLKFAIVHKPFYSDTTAATEQGDPFLRNDGPAGLQSLEGVLSRNNVAIAFGGHAHNYQRNLPDGPNGLLSYVSGTGGGDIESINPSACGPTDAYGLGWSDTDGTGNSCRAPVPPDATHVYGFLKVSVNGFQVTVTPTDEMGRTFDVQTYTFGPTTLVPGSASVPEGDGAPVSLQIPVNLTKAANQTDTGPVDVDWTTVDGTAKAGVDYTASSGHLHWNAGDQSVQYVTVPVIGNTIHQADRTLSIRFTNAQGAVVGGPGVGTGTIVDDDPVAPPVAGGYALDGYGNLTPLAPVGGTAPAVSFCTPVWSWKIARGIALLPDHSGGYLVDGFGGVHAFGARLADGSCGPPPPAPNPAALPPYWSGWDIVRGIALNPAGTGGYTLDGWGGTHPFGIGANPAPPAITGGAYWPGWDIARDLVLTPSGTGGYLLDGFGGVHPFGVGTGTVPPAVAGVPYWPGVDVARSFALTPDGSGAYLLDSWGGIWSIAMPGAAGAPPPLQGIPVVPGSNTYRQLAF